MTLSAMVKGDARIISFAVHEHKKGPIDRFNVPEDARLICIYCNADLLLPAQHEKLKR